jgi:hypothetical protein
MASNTKIDSALWAQEEAEDKRLMEESSSIQHRRSNTPVQKVMR